MTKYKIILLETNEVIFESESKQTIDIWLDKIKYLSQDKNILNLLLIIDPSEEKNNAS